MSNRPLGRVLIVEDDPLRCSWFEQRFTSHVLDVTCDVKQAAQWLSDREYVLILLDHDLVDEHYFSDEPDDERTGYAVAAWLVANPDKQLNALILIHSLNHLGAQRMLDLLREAGRDAEHIPFHYLQDGLRF